MNKIGSEKRKILEANKSEKISFMKLFFRKFTVNSQSPKLRVPFASQILRILLYYMHVNMVHIESLHHIILA